MNPDVGHIIGGRYELTSRIAVGGMGEVWKAMDSVLGREVAVKLLKPEYSSDSTFLTRFRNEARHAAGLSHPNIAGVYDYSDSGGVAYLVMELVPGEPLNQIIARSGALPVREAMSVLAQAARGLAAAHAAGVVHRDVKPGNLLITPNGDVKITDFGIARAGDSVPLTQTGQVMGTAQYLAPEQACGQLVTGASDLYALGVVGYELLIGERPFDGESPVAIAMAHVNNAPPELPMTFTPGARALIASALAKDPHMRPANATTFAEIADLVGEGRDREALAMLSSDDQATTPLTSLMGGAPATTVAPNINIRPTTAPGAYYTPPPPTGSWEADDGLVRARPRKRNNVGIIALTIVLFMLALALFGYAFLRKGPADTAKSTPTTTSAPTTQGPATTTVPTTTTTTTSATTSVAKIIEIKPDNFVGKPVDAVRKALEAEGLVVKQVKQVTNERAADTVISITPSGAVAAGSTVTLVYAVAPAPTATKTTPTPTKTTSTPTQTQTTKPDPTLTTDPNTGWPDPGNG